ncbi:hypothetical protein BIW11_09219 [Tropilaelaps mercedesae]|uniref:Uncharacterized protein n=1 Tax=Tropilaelaps mercedesae TaxID=418985 RepID=A0A1V9XLE0_9ACAR|nr:hypothetical protein BIW11_09219 [Tropilaelaps mercedesae]
MARVPMRVKREKFGKKFGFHLPSLHDGKSASGEAVEDLLGPARCVCLGVKDPTNADITNELHIHAFSVLAAPPYHPPGLFRINTGTTIPRDPLSQQRTPIIK